MSERCQYAEQDCGQPVVKGSHFCPMHNWQERTYTQSDLNAALVAMVEKCEVEAENAIALYAAKYFQSRTPRVEIANEIFPKVKAAFRAILPADIVASVERERKAEIVVVTNVVIESLQEEITKLREAISPGRVGRSTDYYCAVARKMREMETVIRPMESSDAVERERRKLQLAARILEVDAIPNLNWSMDEHKRRRKAALEAELNKKNPQSGQEETC